ncbi:MAG: hypothetical protein GXY61_13625 [Lentisphaerae bacterium]|nr:hypothetical protein [Lentisphaerota bacterium]
MSERVKRWERKWEEEQKARKTEGRNAQGGINWEDMPDVENRIKGYLGDCNLTLSDGAMFKVCCQIVNLKPHIEFCAEKRNSPDREKYGPKQSIKNQLKALQHALNVQPITVCEINRALREEAEENQREYEERCATGEENNFLKRPLSKEEKRAWSEATKHSLRYLDNAVKRAIKNLESKPLDVAKPIDRYWIISDLVCTYRDTIHAENRRASYSPRYEGILSQFINTAMVHILPDEKGVSPKTLKSVVDNLRKTDRL